MNRRNQADGFNTSDPKCGNQALEWLDRVKADLAAIKPGDIDFDQNGDGSTTWTHTARAGLFLYEAAGRLDRMERALRGVMELHAPFSDDFAYCQACSGDSVESWPCPTVTAIQEALG